MLEDRNEIVGKLMMWRGKGINRRVGRHETCDAGVHDPIMAADIPTHEVNTN